MGDDGFGPRVIDLLSQLELPDPIDVRDMGTAGITIASDLSDYSKAIFLDAMKVDGPPGKLHTSRLIINGVPEDFISLSRMTLHDAGLDGLLKFAKAINALPDEVFLIGCQPLTLEVGLGLSSDVEAATHEAVKKVLELIDRD